MKQKISDGTSEPKRLDVRGDIDFIRWVLQTAAYITLPFIIGCDGCQSNRQAPPAEEREVEAAFTPDPAAITLHNRAIGMMGQFDYDAAYQALESLVSENPRWLDAKVDWAIATLNRRQAGDAQRATQLLEAVLKERPDDLRARYCLGILLFDAGDPAKSLEMFESVAAADPLDAYAAYYAGQCEFQLGRIEAALQHYRSAVQRDPYLRSCYYGIFQAERRQSNLETAQEYLDSFQKLDGNPQARLAEIKYTRMGPKAELKPVGIQLDGEPSQRPEGSVFAAPVPLQDSTGAEVPYRVVEDQEHVLPRNVTVAALSTDTQLIVIANGARESDRPNLVFKRSGSGVLLQSEHPFARITKANGFAWGDFDNDGLVDVYVFRDGANQLWRQTEPEVWQDVTESSQTAGQSLNSKDAQFFDADHDGDLDILVMNQGANELFSNNLDGTFRELAATQGLTGDGRNSVSAVVLDIDHDRDLDFIEINAEPPHVVYLNDRLWTYRAMEEASAPAFAAVVDAAWKSVVAVDRDVDGQTELLGIVGEGTEGTRLVFMKPDAQGIWQGEPFSTEVRGSWRAALAVADVDGDAQLDLVGQTETGWVVVRLNDGRVVHEEETPLFGWSLLNQDLARGPALLGLTARTAQLWNPGPGRFSFLGVAFTGKEESADQMRSNRSGIGVDAAARLGTHWMSLRTLRSTSGPGQSHQPLAVGLRGRPQLDFVRVVWPDGIFQTEFDLTSGELHNVSETQRQVASCPVVFAWNGERYEFVTDVLGVGGLGFNVGYGEYGEPRPWENLLLPSDLLKPRQGRFEIKVGEPMEEACYLDAARLVVYDVPAAIDMTLDERFAILAPQPTGQPLFFQQLELPVTAVNDRGESVLEAVSEVDFTAAEPGHRDHRFIGRTETHSIELTFSKPINGQQPYLLFDGWIEYPYSQTMFAAWQAGAAYEAPTIEAQGDDGAWHEVQKEFGYMAGMPRQAVVPLPELPHGTRRLRLTTSVEVYWDRLAVFDAVPVPAELRRIELELSEARLAEVGFAKRTNLAQRRPHYDYGARAPLWDTRHMKGFYSEFGDVNALVRDVDDTVAIMGPGEEVHLSFDAAVPAVPEGFRRWYVLELNGWCKDMDLYTRDGETVTPLPTRGIDLSPEEAKRRQRLHESTLRRFRHGT